MSRDISMHLGHCKNWKCLPLKLSNSVKYLGQHNDEHLSWSGRVEYLADRFTTFSAFLYQLRSGAGVVFIINVFEAPGKSVL